MTSAAAYAEQLAALLPPGAAWRRAPGGVLGQLLAGFAETLFRLHGRVLDLLSESDPRTTSEMLEDWERVLGLPDPCAGPAPTEAQRRNQVIARLRGLDDAGEAGLISFAADLGFPISIRVLQPFRCGVGVCGDPLGPPEIVHVWAVAHPAGDVSVLQCELEALKPAHTAVIFEAA